MKGLAEVIPISSRRSRAVARGGQAPQIPARPERTPGEKRRRAAAFWAVMIAVIAVLHLGDRLLHLEQGHAGHAMAASTAR
jgi:hypothetical protein